MPELNRCVSTIGYCAQGPCNVDVVEFNTDYSHPFVPYDSTAFHGCTKVFVEELNYRELNGGNSMTSPNISPDGQYFFASRSIDAGNSEVFVATRLTDSTWSVAKSLDKPINNESKNRVVGVHRDNKTLLLGNQYNPDGTASTPGYSATTHTGSVWDLPRNVVIEDYYNWSKNSDAATTADLGIIIHSLERDDSFGEGDLYVSHLKPDGEYTAPHNLGDVINSSFDEEAPSISPDGMTLFFSSKRPGFGGYDIWVSRRLDSSWTKWTPPMNLGPAINTPGWDAHFCVTPNQRYAYMCTSDGFRSGLYRLRIPDDIATRKLISGQ